MKVIAITGGIASGKSTVRQWLEKHNIVTIDTDKIAKQLVKKGMPALKDITDAFNGQRLLNPQGELDRIALRQLIFNDPKAKQTLEAILHPLIRQKTQQKLEHLASENNQIVAIEIPLLTETGVPSYVDEVWVIECLQTSQIKRAMERGLNEEEVQKIIKAQATAKQRRAIANVVINSDVALQQMYNQLQELTENR